MMWHQGTGNAGDWLAMAVLLLSMLIAAAVTWLLCRARATEGASHATVNSLRRLQHADAALVERFAQGEINAEEFQRYRELIHSQAQN